MQHSGTSLAEVGVKLRMPAPEGLFHRILNARLQPYEAAWWRDRPDLEPLLKEARPAAVVRLADLIGRTMAIQGCDDAAARAVIGAYRNWDAYLQTRFMSSELDLRSRILLIAVAMLEHAPEAAVYEAATALREQLDVPPEEGHGLAGEGTRSLRGDAEVNRADDGTVRFAKPAFAESVLDYVARTYPDVWQRVRSWAVELPGRLRAPLGDLSVSACLARTLTELAIRRGDLDLLQRAAYVWSTSAATRPLAVEALSMAVVAPGLGRRTRQWMYDCAYHRRPSETMLTAIAEACAQYGTVYPENALTRLRHLAAHDSELVRSAVRQALTELAGDARIQTRILTGLADRLQGTKGRATGCAAFLDIMEARDGADRPALIGAAAQRGANRLSEALSRGWRAALTEPTTADRARTVIAAWLDDALSALPDGPPGRARAETVIRILGQGARDDARYLPRLVRAADAWYEQADPSADRMTLRRELVDNASSADPFAAAQRGEGAA